MRIWKYNDVYENVIRTKKLLEWLDKDTDNSTEIDWWKWNRVISSYIFKNKSNRQTLWI